MKIAEPKDYTGLDYIIAVPTHQRPEYMKRSKEMFPTALHFINESELDDYKDCDITVVPHNKTRGYGSVCNFIFDWCKRNKIRYVGVFDDDKNKLVCMVGNRERNLLKFDNVADELVLNACQILEDLDASWYSFSTSSSIIKYQQNAPVTVNFSLPQGAFIYKVSEPFRFREGINYFEDFDLLMEIFKKHRYIITEQRYLCLSKGEANAGGINAFRNEVAYNKSKNYIQNKWGRFVNFVHNSSGTERPTCTVNYKAI